MFSKNRPHLIILLLAVALLNACANRAVAPIEQKSPSSRAKATIYRQGQTQLAASAERPDRYQVNKGDTLHSIAWRFGIDYRDLAKWNRIRNPNLIFVGQRLSLKRPPTKSVASNKVLKKSPRPPTKKRTTQAKKPSPRVASAPTRVTWTWPTKGRVQAATSASGTKGIEILGQRGQPVLAAARGKVVYSGSGLRGYGRLIIVKHSEEYLSAYAHNERLLVKEGAAVNRGEQIAKMGDSESKHVMLHFEIRRNGKTVAPRKLLPRR